MPHRLVIFKGHISNLLNSVKEHIEYPIVLTTYFVSKASLNPFLSELMSKLASLFFALVLVILTHFVKRHLKKKYP